MPSDAALAIVGSVSVGLAGVGASIVSVFKTTSAQDRRERHAVKRDVYAHFWALQTRTTTTVTIFREEQESPNDEARKAEARQLIQDLTEAQANLQLAGGVDLGVLAWKLVLVLIKYHQASLSTMPSIYLSGMDGYGEAAGDLFRAMRADLGEHHGRRRKSRGLMWPSG